MALITLLAWCKKHQFVYSAAQKLTQKGELPVTRNETGKRVLIDEDFPPPTRETIPCLVCGRHLPQITATHLKLHGMTVQQYKAAFPGAVTVSTEVSAAISKVKRGSTMTPEQKKRVSDGKKGKRPAYHPRYEKGVHKASDETRKKMSESRKGKKHTEETKRKIGEGNRGKIISDDQRETQSIAMREYWDNNAHPMLGRNHSEETRAALAEMAVIREAAKPMEVKRARGLVNRGKKRTPEQKKRYREARIAYMKANPTVMKPSKAEVIMTEWLLERGLRFIPQHFVGDHPYDFYLPDQNLVIEMDGAHHWDNYWVRANATEEMLDEQMEKDAVENMRIGRLGWRIIRIYYRIIPGDSEWGTIDEQVARQGGVSGK